MTRVTIRLGVVVMIAEGWDLFVFDGWLYRVIRGGRIEPVRNV